MTEGTEGPQEIKEAPQESQEVAEARQALDRAAIDPAAEIQSREELTIENSEAREEEYKEAVDSVPESASAKPAEIRLTQVEGAGEGQITIEPPAVDMDPDPVDGTDSEMDPDPVDVDQGPDSESLETVQTVDRVQPEESAEESNYSSEMSEAKPGAVRGFENEDGSKTYAFTGEGETTTSSVADTVQANEELTVPAEKATEPVQEIIREDSPSGSASESLKTAPASPAPETLEQGVEAPLTEGSPDHQAGDAGASADKLMGTTPSAGLELPDDEQSTDSLGSMAAETGEDRGVSKAPSEINPMSADAAMAAGNLAAPYIPGGSVVGAAVSSLGQTDDDSSSDLPGAPGEGSNNEDLDSSSDQSPDQTDVSELQEKMELTQRIALYQGYISILQANFVQLSQLAEALDEPTAPASLPYESVLLVNFPDPSAPDQTIYKLLPQPVDLTQENIEESLGSTLGNINTLQIEIAKMQMELNQINHD